MVGFMEPVGTSFQSATADRKAVMAMTMTSTERSQSLHALTNRFRATSPMLDPFPTS